MAVESIISEIEKLSVLELAELVKALEEKFGVTAQAAVVAAPGGGGGDAATEVEEQTEFDVVLSSSGDKKNPGDQGCSQPYLVGSQRSQSSG